MNYSIFDIETNGLIETVTKIHCMSVNKVVDGVSHKFTLTDYEDIKKFILSEDVLIGHKIITYDIPVLEKLLDIKIKAKLIDTLALSWYLYPSREQHGLLYWGNDLGINKPEIEDWEGLTLKHYIYRCEQDVEINTALWDMQISYLNKIYNNDPMRFIGYITFKMLCAREQEEVKWRLDVAKCTDSLEFLKKELTIKFETLKKIMPKVIEYKVNSRPKTLYKKDGKLSVKGEEWLALLQSRGLPDYHVGAVKTPVSETDGNPGSHQQMKAWLYSLGWVPITFKYVRKDYDTPVRKIEQISLPDGSGICESVKKLFEVEPRLEALEGLFIVKHRIGILEGFLANRDSQDMLKAEIKGLTNTLRFQHTTIVNLPSVHKAYGDIVRGCLITPDNEHELCGSDMSSLEDNTKQHYMYFFDPEYVKEMRVPGFSPHLDIGVQGEMITQEEADFYIWRDAINSNNKEVEDLYYPKVAQKYLLMSEEEKQKTFKAISKIRKDSKQVNFSAVYGVGAPKMSLTTGWPLPKSKNLLMIYWKRNWSVKEVAANCKVKNIDGHMWLYNPVSKFWYSLRYDKDRFSTLNQGTGVYCFDRWVSRVRSKGYKMCGQFHDEIIVPVQLGQRDKIRKDFKDSIAEVNKELNLNIQLDISVDFGDTYAAIH